MVLPDPVANPIDCRLDTVNMITWNVLHDTFRFSSSPVHVCKDDTYKILKD